MPTHLSPAELKARFPNATADLLAVNQAPVEWMHYCDGRELRLSGPCQYCGECPGSDGRAKGGAPERPLNLAERRREVKELHRPFMQWLDLHKFLYIYCRADRASGIRIGWPDFTIIDRGRAVCVEMKWPGARLRKEQAEIRDLLFFSETPWVIATSVEEAIQFVRAELLQREGA